MSPSTTEWRATFRDYITKRGMRLTDQRLAIAEAFFEQEGHANVEELYEVVRRRKPGIGHATVYRTIKLLAECGLAEPRNFGDGTTRFEPSVGDEHHDHLICEECGLIIEFENDAIERLQEDVASAHGFRLTRHKMELYGVCDDFRVGRRCSRRALSENASTTS